MEVSCTHYELLGNSAGGEEIVSAKKKSQVKINGLVITQPHGRLSEEDPEQAQAASPPSCRSIRAFKRACCLRFKREEQTDGDDEEDHDDDDDDDK